MSLVQLLAALGSPGPMQKKGELSHLCSRCVCLGFWEITTLSWQNFWWGKVLSVETSLSCAEHVDFFLITSHKYSAANSSGCKTKMYMISLSAKHLLCHLNSQSETLPNQRFFHCFSPESFLETKSHPRINKCWSESSLSRGMVCWAGIQVLFFEWGSLFSSGSTCATRGGSHWALGHQVPPGWGGSTWLRVQLCKSARALSGVAAGQLGVYSAPPARRMPQVLLFFANSSDMI